MDPFLRYLKKLLPTPVTRAFADDIGTLIQALLQVPIIHSAFSLYHRISNLALKPNKCVGIPLGAPITKERILQTRDYIASRAQS